MNRRWLTGALLFMGGLGFAGSGFVYDVMFAGIPFQDAPKQLRNQYAIHSTIALCLEILGLLIVGTALLFVAISLVRRPHAPRSSPRE